MPDANDERRKNDESFRYRILEQQAEIKSLIGSTKERIESLSNESREHTASIAELRYAMFGGPKESDVGLIEKHRRLQKNWTIIISICAVIFSAIGKSIEPFIKKIVTDYIYESPSERWRVEQKRPKVRVYKIYPDKREPNETTP